MIIHGRDRVHCHKCALQWEAETYIETDTNYYELSEATAFCPACGHEPYNALDCYKCWEERPSCDSKNP